MGWLRVLRRGLPLAALVFGGLVLFLIVRLIECLTRRGAHPWTPGITQRVCQGALWLIGIDHGLTGKPMTGTGAIVANHSSWLDIFTLNACGRLVFVSKAEVADWPGIGWLARATGTVFITRKTAEAGHHRALILDRLQQGQTLLFFPEGTSTDGRQVLPFKSALFAAFFDDGLPGGVRVQPASVFYTAPEGAPDVLYGWWGDMEFASHLLQLLARPVHGRVHVTFGDPIPVANVPDRKALARRSEEAVRKAMPEDIARNV